MDRLCVDTCRLYVSLFMSFCSNIVKDDFERPVDSDEAKDEEMDFREGSELEDLMEEIREQSNDSYYPFPSKIFALLY